MILLIQRGRCFDRIVGELGKLGNRLAYSLAGRFLHRHSGLGDASETLARDLAVAGEQRENCSSLSSGAHGCADLARHIAQLPSTQTGVVAGQDQ
ncbi:hypothetical protein D3C80_1371200 [compost metagenome]